MSRTRHGRPKRSQPTSNATASWMPDHPGKLGKPRGSCLCFKIWPCSTTDLLQILSTYKAFTWKGQRIVHSTSSLNDDEAAQKFLHPRRYSIFLDPEHPDLYLYAIVSQSAFLLTHCVWKRTWEIYHSVIQWFQILMLGILNKTLWSVPILQKCPKLSHVLAQKFLPVLLSARFASASLKPISITCEYGARRLQHGKNPMLYLITWFSSSRFLVFGTEDRPAMKEFVKTCRHQLRRVAKTMLKFSKFASFRSTKMLHLTSQLCLLWIEPTNRTRVAPHGLVGWVAVAAVVAVIGYPKCSTWDTEFQVRWLLDSCSQRNRLGESCRSGSTSSS